MTPGERALRESAAVIHPLPRAVFRLTGATPLAYLHDVLAQDVADLEPGRGALAVALSPKGRVSAEVRVIPRADDVLVDAEPEARGGIEERIGRHAGLAGCELLDESGERVVAAIRGPQTDERLAAAGIAVPASYEAAFVDAGPILLVRVVWGVAGVDVFGLADSVPETVRSLDLPSARIDDLDAARIAAGRPRFGPDVSEDLLVNETPLLAHAVAPAKGCYPGQESVARVRTLGGVRRMLRALRASEGRIEPGGGVTLEGALVGRVTSAAPLPNGGSVAIALLRADAAPGASVVAGDVEAVVSELQ